MRFPPPWFGRFSSSDLDRLANLPRLHRFNVNGLHLSVRVARAVNTDDIKRHRIFTTRTSGTRNPHKLHRSDKSSRRRQSGSRQPPIRWIIASLKGVTPNGPGSEPNCVEGHLYGNGDLLADWIMYINGGAMGSPCQCTILRRQ